MRLTENMIVARSKQSDLSTIKRINLWGCDLTDISIVENMTNVEVLALSINNLSCLQPLQACSKLQVLYLRKNNIEDFNELKYLKNLTMLTELWLAENPCAIRAGSKYRASVLKILPNLKKLDNEDVTPFDIEESKKLDFPQTEILFSHCDLPLEELSLQQEPLKAELPKSEIASPIQEPFEPKTENFDVEEELNFTLQKQIPSPREVKPPQPEKVNQPVGLSEERFETNTQPSPTSEAIPNIEMQHVRHSLPPSFPAYDHEHQPETAKTLGKTQSLSQIPQLKLVLQIQPTQGTVEQPLNIEYPPWSEANVADDTPRNRYDSVSERAGYTNRNANLLRLEQGSRTTRTSASMGLQNDSGWNSFSRTNRATNSPKSQRNFPSLDGSQTNRSMNANDNLTWEDGLPTNRSYASRTSETNSTLYSSRSSRRNANVLSALLCLVPELEMDSLQVLEHSIQCRLDELNEQ